MRLVLAPEHTELYTDTDLVLISKDNPDVRRLPVCVCVCVEGGGGTPSQASTPRSACSGSGISWP